MPIATLKRQAQHDSAPMLPATWSYSYACSIDGFDTVVEHRDDKVFVHSEELELISHGHSFDEARSEFVSLLSDYMDSLASREKSLASNLKAHLEILRSKLTVANGQE